MSDVPLLKELQENIESCNENEVEVAQYGNKLLTITKSALRKFQDAGIVELGSKIKCRKCGKFTSEWEYGYSIPNKEKTDYDIYHKKCWEEEVFGVLDSQNNSHNVMSACHGNNQQESLNKTMVSNPAGFNTRKEVK
jgi:hypothetical protein